MRNKKAYTFKKYYLIKWHYYKQRPYIGSKDAHSFVGEGE